MFQTTCMNNGMYHSEQNLDYAGQTIYQPHHVRRSRFVPPLRQNQIVSAPIHSRNEGFDSSRPYADNRKNNVPVASTSSRAIVNAPTDSRDAGFDSRIYADNRNNNVTLASTNSRTISEDLHNMTLNTTERMRTNPNYANVDNENSERVTMQQDNSGRTSTVSGIPQETLQEQLASVVHIGRVYGSTEKEKMFIFTGTVERVFMWSRIFQNHFCFFDVIASVVSVCDGSVQFQKVILLNDTKGPILQVNFYSNSTYIRIEDFHVGQFLRCIGRMVGPNILSAASIRNATPDEVEKRHRLSWICDNAVSHFLTA